MQRIHNTAPFIQGTGASLLGALGLAPISTGTKEHIFGVSVLAAVEFTTEMGRTCSLQT